MAPLWASQRKLRYIQFKQISLKLIFKSKSPASKTKREIFTKKNSSKNTAEMTVMFSTFRKFFFSMLGYILIYLDVWQKARPDAFANPPVISVLAASASTG